MQLVGGAHRRKLRQGTPCKVISLATWVKLMTRMAAI